MPVATMDKDRRAVAREHDVGPPRQLPLVQPKPETGSVQQRAQMLLGAGILAADARHVPAAMLFGQDVDHHPQLGRESRTSPTMDAICRARCGGTALPT